MKIRATGCAAAAYSTRRLALGGLELFKGRAFFAHLATTAVVGASALLVVEDALNYKLDLPAAVALEIGIAASVFVVPQLLLLLMLRRDLGRAFEVIASMPAKAMPMMLRLMSGELEELEQRIDKLRRAGRGIAIGRASDWVKRNCFEATNGRYLATDSNPPSRYMARYRDFLAAHADYLTRTDRKDSVRMLLVSRQVLMSDRRAHPRLFEEFVEWHKQKHVELRYLAATTAKQVRQEFGIKATDMAFWKDELVLSWITSANGRVVQVQMAVAGEHDYTQSQKYLDKIIDRSKSFPADFVLTLEADHPTRSEGRFRAWGQRSRRLLRGCRRRCAGGRFS